MKYTKEQRLDIGRQIYTHEISKADAMEHYAISKSCAEGYVTDYKRAHGIPLQQHKLAAELRSVPNGDLETYRSLSKEELIQELIQSKANSLALKYKFGNRHFWAEGYYLSTVGLNEETIKKYIQEQEKHDIALDKLSVKEYSDPFKG